MKTLISTLTAIAIASVAATSAFADAGQGNHPAATNIDSLPINAPASSDNYSANQNFSAGNNAVIIRDGHQR